MKNNNLKIGDKVIYISNNVYGPIQKGNIYIIDKFYEATGGPGILPKSSNFGILVKNVVKYNEEYKDLIELLYINE